MMASMIIRSGLLRLAAVPSPRVCTHSCAPRLSSAISQQLFFSSTPTRLSSSSSSPPSPQSHSEEDQLSSTHHIDCSDSAYFDKRIQDINAFQHNLNVTAYPASWSNSIGILEFVHQFSSIEKGARLEDLEFTLAGRILSKREASKKLLFYTISSDNGTTVQVMSTLNSWKQSSSSSSSSPSLIDVKQRDHEFHAVNDILKRGDIVGVRGFPAKTNTGELSIIPRELVLLAPCLHQLPTYSGLKDPEVRFRKRHLDLIINEQVRNTFRLRSRVINYIRSFLDSHGFLEVETPMLHAKSGGASAKPFVTHLNALNLDFKLRIAPELHLKQLIVGGFDRVYEMGRQFRNEGMDGTHNPEFTTCEFYQAYADYESLMTFTEQMLSTLVFSITGGSHAIQFHLRDGEQVKIDFTPPFRRVSYVEELEKHLAGEKVPHASDPNAVEKLTRLCRAHNVDTRPPLNYGHLIDRLFGHFVEPGLVQPTFVVDHPTPLSPLAKQHRSKSGISERFELFAATKELCNAYTELNDPIEQRERFLSQERDRAAGDLEAQELDETFCNALEYGLPPTAGWGLGIDRLVMLLTDSHHIRDVLLFPMMKPDTPHSPRTLTVFCKNNNNK